MSSRPGSCIERSRHVRRTFLTCVTRWPAPVNTAGAANGSRFSSVVTFPFQECYFLWCDSIDFQTGTNISEETTVCILKKTIGNYYQASRRQSLEDLHSQRREKIKFHIHYRERPIPMGARSKAWVCGRSLARIVGSNPTGSMDICLLWVLCVVR
jgi:hypothetical protein